MNAEDGFDITEKFETKIIALGMRREGFVSFATRTDIDEIFGIRLSDMVEDGLITFEWLNDVTTPQWSYQFRIKTTKRGEDYWNCCNVLSQM